MKLFHSPLSPYVRKVMIVAHEMGLVDQIELLAGTGTPMAPNDEVVAANPVGRIPALITDDAGALMDSRVICRYLNAKGGGSMYGAGDDWGILAREALAEGVTDSSLLGAYEFRLRPEDKQFQPFVDGQYAKIRRGLKAFNDRIGEMGGDFTMDQVSLIAACGHVDFRHGALGWRDDCPALADWIEKMATRPSVAATVPS